MNTKTAMSSPSNASSIFNTVDLDGFYFGFDDGHDDLYTAGDLDKLLNVDNFKADQLMHFCDTVKDENFSSFSKSDVGSDHLFPQKSPSCYSDSGVSDILSVGESPRHSDDICSLPPVPVVSEISQVQQNYKMENSCASDGSGMAQYHTLEQVNNSSFYDYDIPNQNVCVPMNGSFTSHGTEVLKNLSSKLSDSKRSVPQETSVCGPDSQMDENALNYFKKPSPTSTAGNASIKIVKVLQSKHSPHVTSDEVVKAIDERSRKNAKQAKLNREKKKAYIKSLESDRDDLQEQNKQLLAENRKMNAEMAALEDEVEYLKSVLANSSALSGLLQNLTGVTNVHLSSTLMNRKRSAVMDHETDVAIPRKRSRFIQENLKKAGVCLHVTDGCASLEFCAKCSTLARKSMSSYS